MCLDNKKLSILKTGMAKDRWILVLQNPKKQHKNECFNIFLGCRNHRERDGSFGSRNRNGSVRVSDPEHDRIVGSDLQSVAGNHSTTSSLVGI